jgi:hypothetical protein
MLERWQTLLNQLELPNRKALKPFTEAELSEFEYQTSTVLPVEYKEFCQIFSPGTFGADFLYIHQPSVELSQESIGFYKQALAGVATMVRLNPCDVAQTMSLLGSAFVFGGSSRQEDLFWDLRTYSESDQSYDIYLARLGSVSPVLIGRNFFDFVHDICLGMNPHTTFPAQLRPYLDEICLTFS